MVRTRLKDVQISRQAGERRSRRLGRGASKAASWRAPLRRARRAIDSTITRLETSGRVIDATARFAAGRPLETSRRLHRLSRWMGEATVRLELALRGFSVSSALAAGEPDRAQALLADTALRFAAAVVRLDAVSARVADVSERLLHLVGRVQPAVPARPARVRCAPLRHAPVVLVRRRSFVITFAAEIAIELCRGRAPPSISPAPLIHRS